MISAPPSLSSSTGPPPSTPVTPLPLPNFPSAFAAFANQLRTAQLHTLLQSQISALQSQRTHEQQHSVGLLHTSSPGPIQKQRGSGEYSTGRKRMGGPTVKTAKVWRFFDELPTVEQATECRLCRKKIKATNSSTTGMIRHLRSCHVQEYQLVQEARQNTMLIKMDAEEKARAKLLREMNEKVASTMATHIGQKKGSGTGTGNEAHHESQKSPSALSSASDTASSTNSSLFGHLLQPDALAGNAAFVPQLQKSALHHDLPAPKPVVLRLKTDATEVEEETVERPTDLSLKSAFSALTSGRKAADSMEPEKTTNEEKARAEQEQHIHMQVALMLLLDQHPPTLVDRPGFRALLRYLLPDYQLPSSFVFQTVICPRLLEQMRQQLTSLFSLNNPIANPLDSLVSMQTIKAENKDDSEQLKVDEKDDEEGERESSSEVDLPSVEALGQIIDTTAYTKEEVSSLMTICHSIYSYFNSKPALIAELQMWTPSSSAASIRELEFAHHNAASITSYVRANPDMSVLPLSSVQLHMLQELVQKI